MERVVLDSSAVIEMLRGTKKGEAILAMVSGKEIELPSVAAFELLRGPPSQRPRTKAFIDAVHDLPFDRAVAEEAALLEERLRHQGVPLGALDLLIAASAATRGTTLVTADADFKRVKDLNVQLV